MIIGICKLCENQKELKKSHIIPRAVFKRALKGYTYGIMLDNEYNKIIKVQDQWAKYMLCAECEHLLNVNYEQYSLDVLRNNLKEIKFLEKGQYLQIENIDQTRMVLFVISILWRAIESDHKIFNQLKILNIELIIRKLLQNCVKHKVLPNLQFFSVRISKLVTTIDDLKDLKLDFITNLTFKPVVAQKRIRFLIIFEGYCFEIFFHSDPKDRLTGLGVLNKKKKILKLPYIDAFTIPELHKSILNMFEAKNSKFLQ